MTVSVQDTISVADTPSVEPTIDISVSDSISLTDSPVVGGFLEILVSEAVSVADSPSAAFADLAISESESISVIDKTALDIVPGITPGDLALLRAGDHRVELYLSVWQPSTLWSARIDDGSITRGEQTIAFDAGAGSDFSAIQEHQTVWIGSAAGLHDVGKLRIKSISSGDAGVTGTLVVGANSLDFTNNDYITFLHDYEVWSVFNRVDSSEVYYKDWENDGGLTYTDENTDIPPVAIGGPHQVGFLSSGTITFSLPVGDSYAMASGATISSKSVTVYPSAGVTVNPESGGYINVDITAAGQYVAKITVTDSRGTPQITFRKLIVHNSSPDSADYPLSDFSSATISGDWNRGGWNGTVRVNRSADIATIPDGNLAILWRRTWYGDTQKDISLLQQGKNILLSGYLRKGSISKEESDATLSRGTVSFQITTPESLLSARPLFSVPLEVANTVNTWWKYQNGLLTAGHIVHYLYRWHSTLFHTTDVIGLDDDGDIDRKAIDFQKGTLYRMGDEFVRRRGIQAHIVSDKSGRVRMSRDLVFRSDSIRGAAPVIATLDESDTTDPVTFIHAPENRVSFVFYSGLTYDGTNADPIGSVSPSQWPDVVGSQQLQVERQMITSQGYANRQSGQIFAVENNEWPEVRVAIHGDYLGLLEPALMQWWQMDVASGDTPKGFIWTDQNMICRNVKASINLEGGTISAQATFETEADGIDGETYLWPDTTPAPGGDTLEVFDPGAGAGGFAILTGSSVYYLPGGSSTWELRTNAGINDVIQDPFWRTSGKQNTTNPTSAILLTAENGRVRRSTNSGTNFATLSPGNPPNDEGDAPAPTLADLEFVEVEGSLIDDGTFVWLARWESGGGDWRSWLLHTDDNGSSFTWQSLGGDIAGSVVVTDTAAVGGATSIGPFVTVKLTNSRFLSAGTDDISDPVWLNELSGDTITLLDSIDSGSSGAHPDMIRLTDTKALWAYSESGNSVRCVVVDVTGDNISVGSELTIASGTGLALANGTGGGQAYIVYNENGGDVMVQELGISGTTVSKNGSAETITTNNVQDIAAHAVNAGTFDGILVCYRDVDQSNKPYARKVTFSPYSAGTEYELDSTAMSSSNDQEGRKRLAPITPTSKTMVFTWISTTNDALSLIAINATTATLSLGSILTSTSNSRTPSIDTHGSSSDLIVAYYQDVDDDTRAFTISVSGTTITDNSDEFDVQTVANNSNNMNVVSISSVTAIVTVAYTVPLYWHAINIRTGGTAAMKAQGLSIGRGAGDLIYTTSWTDDDLLILSTNLMSDLSLVSEYSLGTVTEAQVDAKTWWAHPLAIYGDDGEVVIFGRMNNPGGLGTVHMLHSYTAGASVTIMEDGVGSNYIGAACQDYFGTLYAMENISAAAPKLYSALPPNTLALLSTATGVTAGVNPKAMTADWDGNILVGMDTGAAVMVIYTPAPFIAWNDITGNHGIADGINSIEVL